jgi:hypothetical protein
MGRRTTSFRDDGFKLKKGIIGFFACELFGQSVRAKEVDRS